MTKDYFPLWRGLKLDYRHDPGSGKRGKMRFEVLSVDLRPGIERAKCVRIFDGQPSPHYEMTKDEKKGWLSSTNWGREFPLNPKPGQEWSSGSDVFQVDALDAEIETPADTFTDCLKIVRLAAGGDVGVEERYYAEEVGLVYALSTDESDPYELALTAGLVRIPGLP